MAPQKSLKTLLWGWLLLTLEDEGYTALEHND